MIQVSQLTKRFGATLAIDGISFEIPRGQIVGFLGPNGAGKSTTMRLLTGYLPPDSGDARLAGHDLAGDTLAVRRRLGYLPENNPLPEDMEVTEFLELMAVLRGVRAPAERRERIRSVVARCGLHDAVGKLIGELSKGYRQRVGLAHAILHDPDILILDEPTSGLDPNQVQEVRELIRELKRDKTVLLSTHILSEVRHICDRVLIIAKGRIVADGRPDELAGRLQGGTRLVVEMRGPAAQVAEALRGLEGVTAVSGRGEGIHVVEAASGVDVRERVFALGSRNNWPILSMQVETMSLEDVFSTLTAEEPRG